MFDTNVTLFLPFSNRLNFMNEKKIRSLLFVKKTILCLIIVILVVKNEKPIG